MVSKRRRLAKKRFKEANPLLFPKPEIQTHDQSFKQDDDEKRKKKDRFKTQGRGVGRSRIPRERERFSSSKHPLRVPGQRPGESCFVCGAGDHIAKICPMKTEWEKNKICLLCRRRGHSLKNCPDKNNESKQNLCYNCGDTGHSLSKCPQPLQDGGAKFATCFVCKQQGHLSKDCPKNAHGIYPMGGCCKICGGVTHLARNCPKKGSQEFSFYQSEADYNAVGEYPKTFQEKRNLIRSGDDLEDDFVTDEEPLTRKKPNPESDLGSPKVKSKDKDIKKKKGPKVIIFLG
ncbi:VASCULAR-RELATED NAC-DOMAIN 6 [Wolffia australiana]